MPIRIVLVDDHALVRQGFRRILEDDPELQVAGEAGNGLDAVALVKKTDPDVVVMDMAMPEMNGLHATMEMVKQRPDTKVLILSMYSDEQYVRNALDAGAKGYILKNAIENDLVRAVKAVAAGEQYLSPELSTVLIRAIKTGAFSKSVDPVRQADAAREAGAAAHRARQVEQGDRGDAGVERQHGRRAPRQPDERARRAQDGRARAVRGEKGTGASGVVHRAFASSCLRDCGVCVRWQ